jgi:hypothetical protein
MKKPLHALGRGGAALLAAAALGGGLGAAAAQGRAPGPGGAALPLRNLLVEVRQSEHTRTQEQQAGVSSGGVVVRSDGQVSGSAGVTLQAGSQARDGGVTQQVRVLNGAQASVRLSRALALQWWQVTWTPQGVQALPGVQWLEAARGFVVRPAWPGGDQPVQVEVSAEGARLQADPAAPGTDGRRVLTTVQVPLGQWVTIASSDDTAGRSERGVLSSREAQSARQEVVELRVTAP